MSKRMFPPKKPDPEGPKTPSSLQKALDATGRSRMSSATPQLSAPAAPSPSHPKGSYYAQVEKFRVTDHIMNPPGGDEPILSTEASTYSLKTSQLAADFQRRVDNLVSKTKESNLNPQMENRLVADIRSIGGAYSNHQKQLEGEFTRILTEKDKFQSRLINAARSIQQINEERDENRAQVVELQKSYDNLREQFAKKGTELEELRRTSKAQADAFKKRLKTQAEQLKGKRALWLEQNPDSSARRSAMTAIRNPFESPLATTSGSGAFPSSFGSRGQMQSPTAMSPFHSFDSGNMGNFPSPSISSPYESFESSSSWGPPPKMNFPSTSLVHLPRRIPGVPDLKALPSTDQMLGPMPSPGIFGIAPQHNPMAFYSQDDDKVPEEFKHDFTMIFIMIEGWVKNYASNLNPDGDRQIMNEKQEVWHAMMNCTYPGNRHDAQSHTLALISDRGCRYWFIMRLITDYAFLKMMPIEAWYGFSVESDAALAEITEMLKERGLGNEGRQNLIDRRAQAIASIQNHHDYTEWRLTQLTFHTTQLRKLLSLVTNPGVDPREAGGHLATMAIRFWEQSAKMHSSPLTFQVYFPETGSKFNSSSMIAKDRPGTNPMQLQIKQVRVKLVITPVITLRDDRGTTIKAKNLHHATCLLMQ